MDRRQFFGAIAAAVVGSLLPGRRLPYEAPTLKPLGNAYWFDPKDLNTSWRVRDIRDAVASLRANNIAAGADGMLEIPIFVADEFQQLNTALPRYERYRRFSPFDFEVPPWPAH